MTMKDFGSGGVHIDTDLYEPRGVANKSAIILAYGSDGLIDNKNGPWATMIREYANDLAQKGFHALVPNYFLRTGTPANSIDYQRGGALEVMKHKDEWQSTVADAVQYAKTLPGIDASRIGLLGYSLGAYLSLRLRAQAKAIVAFFPPWMDGLGPRTTAGLPVHIHYGDKDFLDFAGNTGPIEQELRKNGAVVTLHCYPGANHGFSGSDPANSTARTKSKARTIEFFEASL
jgi:carboxymethylenebutenolidase